MTDSERTMSRAVARAARFAWILAVAGVVAAGAASAQAPPDAPAAPAGDSLAVIAPPPVPGTGPNGPMVVGSKRVRLTASGDNVVRSGPGSGYAIAGVHSHGVTFPVIAKHGEWYGVRLGDTSTGWVHASLCEELDDLSGLEFRPNPRLYTRTGSYVLGGYGGGYAFDRKSNSVVLGGRLGYYVFDRVQTEIGVSWTHVRRAPEVVESLFGLSLESEDFHMMFYQIDVMWELLPGRQMVPFAVAGVGSSIFQGRSEPSLNFGAGTTLFLSKRMATRWEVRDYRFESGSDSARLTNHNIEFTLGTQFLF